jgi:hypothetical protein
MRSERGQLSAFVLICTMARIQLSGRSVRARWMAGIGRHRTGSFPPLKGGSGRSPTMQTFTNDLLGVSTRPKPATCHDGRGATEGTGSQERRYPWCAAPISPPHIRSEHVGTKRSGFAKEGALVSKCRTRSAKYRWALGFPRRSSQAK